MESVWRVGIRGDVRSARRCLWSCRRAHLHGTGVERAEADRSGICIRAGRIGTAWPQPVATGFHQGTNCCPPSMPYVAPVSAGLVMMLTGPGGPAPADLD